MGRAELMRWERKRGDEEETTAYIFPSRFHGGRCERCTIRTHRLSWSLPETPVPHIYGANCHRPNQEGKK
jgi:hypothetical protein